MENNGGGENGLQGFLSVLGELQPDVLSALFARFGMFTEEELTAEQRAEAFGGERPSLESVAARIKNGTLRRIVVLAGAGISVSAGIPDFRTPGTGLYANLQKFNLDAPEDIFDISFFPRNPAPFFELAKDMYPGNYPPTLTHHFLRLLETKGVLLRCYTQNIDCLERVAGLSVEHLVEVHGTFGSAHCIECRMEHGPEDIRDVVMSGGIPRCTADGCNGLVKPDVVFFGEGLPERYFTQHRLDVEECDLMLVMGTSLQVAPVSQLPRKVRRTIPRVLFNRERVGDFNDSEDNYRDVVRLGDVDDEVLAFAEMLGWADELRALQAAAPPTRRRETPTPVSGGGGSATDGVTTAAAPPSADETRSAAAHVPVASAAGGTRSPAPGGDSLTTSPTALTTGDVAVGAPAATTSDGGAGADAHAAGAAVVPASAALPTVLSVPVPSAPSTAGSTPVPAAGSAPSDAVPTSGPGGASV